jgi:hypothetical protein
VVVNAAALRRFLPHLAAAAVVALLAGVVAIWASADDGAEGEQARLVVDGRAVVRAADAPEGETETVTDTATVAFGDVVVIEDGTATLELAAGQRYELRSGDVGSEVVVGAPPTLVAGDLLVVEGFPAAVTHGTTTVSAHGPVKLRAGVPMAAAYAGRSRISGAGSLEAVQALRQVVLTSAAVPEPLTYDPADEWDRRYLGEAIAFGERLEAIARGYTAALRDGGGRSVEFFESVIPALADERQFTADLLEAGRAPGETLIGASIAVQGRDGTFRERWNETFSFREAGAAWGLVALDQGVSSAPVLDTIELAITAPPPAPEAPAAGVTVPPPTTTTKTKTATTTTTTTTTTPTDPSDDPPPPTDPPPAPPPEDDGLIDPLLDPGEDVLGDVLDTLGLG